MKQYACAPGVFSKPVPVGPDRARPAEGAVAALSDRSRSEQEIVKQPEQVTEMATVKLKFRPSSIAGKEGMLFYQVIHARTARQISTGYRLFSWEWDSFYLSDNFPSSCDPSRISHLLKVKKEVSEGLFGIRAIISGLDRSGVPYSSDRVVELFRNSSHISGYGLISFGERLIAEMKRIGKVRTAESYATTLNSFVRFRSSLGDIPLDEVDSSLMAEYEVFLRSHDVCPNSSSYYMRNLRAIYNRAVDKGLVLQRTPFRHVYTGIDKTVKRAVSLKVIRQLRELDLTLTPSLEYARDMFLFSFYTRGMSFVDMAFLKRTSLQNGILSYRRHKTNQQLFIRWEPLMQEIVDKYFIAGLPYLLPVIKDITRDERRQYLTAAHFVNEKLKLLGHRLGLSIPLTMYVARHAWASIARSKNVPLAVISEAMGHDSENTTRIYLSSLDTSVVDKANDLILKSL